MKIQQFLPEVDDRLVQIAIIAPLSGASEV